jgi:hypothetical protein
MAIYSETLPMKRLPTVREHTEIHGRIIRLGGRDETIPVSLMTHEGEVIACAANIDMAKKLKDYLLEPVYVILSGMGKWTRQSSGGWKLSEFIVNEVSPMDDSEFDDALRRIQALGSGWDIEENPEAALLSLRHGD